MKILIYGFGRMGLTHYSILKGLNPKIKFTIVEPNRILRKLLNKNIDAEFFMDDLSFNDKFDVTLITTPPLLHLNLLKHCIDRGDDKIFVEKPFGGSMNLDFDTSYDLRKIYIGYVLRFNPCIQWVKRNIARKEICFIGGKFLSNTLVSKPSGWRNGPFSGVLNEVGSHVIDLIQYITGEDQFDVLEVEVKSLVSDIDDIIKAKLKTKHNVAVELYFNWVEKNVRKPLFQLEIKMKNGDTYTVDQQQIKYVKPDQSQISRIGVTDLGEIVPFYLRGIDFSKQMEDLLGDGKILAQAKNGLSVNGVMSKIIQYENNPGR